MRVRVCLWIGKVIRFILVKMGRGGSMPGRIVLKLCPNFLTKITYPEVVIMVTGTNGKTTTSNMIYEVLQKKYSRVIANRKGDNLKEGITTLVLANTSASLRVKADAMVIEVDELNVPKVMKDVSISAFVVNNFFRDQLDRAGEMESIVSKIESALTSYEGVLLLNGDDPNVARLGYHRRNTKYFHVEKTAFSTSESKEASEGKFCFHCNHPLEYEYYQYSHIGKFTCSNCDFTDFKYDLVASNVDVEHRSIECNGEVIHAPQNALYSIYNTMAVLSVASMYDVDFKVVNSVLSNFALNDGRNELFDIGKDCLLNLVKNPTGANETMKYIQREHEDKDIMIILNDNDQDGKDVSWIWDAQFELIIQDNVKHIICSGLRAYDMALRLKYANYGGEIIVIESVEDGVKALKQLKNKAYVIATYTALQHVRAVLRRNS